MGWINVFMIAENKQKWKISNTRPFLLLYLEQLLKCHFSLNSKAGFIQQINHDF